MFKKIFFSYLATILVAFASITIIFSLTVRNHLINDTTERLHQEAATLSKRATVRSILPGSGQPRRSGFQLANILVHAEYIVVQSDGEIIDSSNHETFLPGSIIKGELFNNMPFNELFPVEKMTNEYSSSELVAVFYPVTQVPGQHEAVLILYSRLNILSELNQNILHVLGFSLAVGLIVALIAGSLTTRIIINPINQLKIMAAKLSKRKYSDNLILKTGDELQELAEAFNEMSKELSEHDKSQKLFFQRASHELKTPLMSVQGYAEALKDGIVDASESEEALAIIIREANRMKKLVEEFMFLSKVETIKPENELKPALLSELASEAVKTLKGWSKEKTIEYHQASNPDESTIYANPDMIYRLILNIAGNALRYAQGKVKIETGDKTIKVIDDGPGFNEEELDKIFNPFYCGKGGESGLGLTISKAIAEKYGGTIIASNHSDGGAEVKVIFHSSLQKGLKGI